MIVTVDHGRGRTPQDWRNHGETIEGAQDIWIAIVDPGSPRRGEWANAPTVHQNQIPATLARALGFEFAESNPHSGQPLQLCHSRPERLRILPVMLVKRTERLAITVRLGDVFEQNDAGQ